MGKWAQGRRRGGGGNCRRFPLEPPGDAEWEFATPGGGSGQTAGDIISGICAVGADGWRMQVSNDVEFGGFDETDADCNASNEPTADFGPPGDTIYGRIRWLLAGVPVSDWSVTKILS